MAIVLKSSLFFLFILSSGFLSAKPFSYKVTGKIDGLEEGRMVFMGDPYQIDGTFPRDTAYISNGVFSFEGTLAYPQQAAVTYSMSAEEVEFWLDEGETQIIGTQGKLRHAETTGSAIPAQLNEFLEWTRGVNSEKESLEKSIAFIKEHPAYYYSTMVLWRIKESITEKELMELMALIDPKWHDAFAIKELRLFIEARKTLAVGRSAPNVSFLSEKGDTVWVEDFLGSYVYLDFWASYCAPCIKQMPEIIALHEKYGEEGLQIVSVSTDTYPGKWTIALEKYPLPFINCIVMNENALEVDAAYHVQVIPHGVLIGPKGTVLAIHPDTAELRALLKQHLGH